MEQKKKAAVPLVCHGHSRPVVDLFYSPVTPDGYFLISASKGEPSSSIGVACDARGTVSCMIRWGGRYVYACAP
jgi:serine-threonine kinase receptor-associated protein